MPSLSAVMFAMQDRLRAGPTSWGSCYLFDMVLVFALPGAVPVVGGSSDPSVPWSPGVSLQRGQGGPWAPPPAVSNPWETLLIYVVFLWCLDLGFLVWGCVWCYSSLEDSTLCSLYICWSTLSLSIGCYVRRRRFSLFSLSGAGETQTL